MLEELDEVMTCRAIASRGRAVPAGTAGVVVDRWFGGVTVEVVVDGEALLLDARPDQLTLVRRPGVPDAAARRGAA